MLRRGLLFWGGIAAAQTLYIQLRPEGETLRTTLMQSLHAPQVLGRSMPLWRGLSQIEQALPRLSSQEGEWFVLHFTGREVSSLVDSLRLHPAIAVAETAQKRRLCTGPPSLPGWHHVALGTSSAWTRTQGQPSIVIALIDSGTDWNLPAFHRQLWTNPLEDLNGNGTLDADDLNGIDDDGNGYVDDVIGYDFTDQPFGLSAGDFVGTDPWPLDENGHGTAMASVMVARPDKSPVAGVAPGCRLMVLRAFNAEGYGEDDDIARSIVYAVQNGARIINCSFGDERPSQLMRAAIRYATTRGVVVVAASGNGTGRRPHYPSGFPEVVSVGGLAYEEETGKFYLWPLSGYYRVDWIAPADRVPALLPGGEIRLLSGTSLAAALTSAAAGLLLSQYPNIGPNEVRSTFAARAVPLLGSQWSPYTGSGRLQLLPALDYPQSSLAGWLSPAEEVVLTAPTPFVFSTYHSLLSQWEIHWLSDIDAGGIPLLAGTTPLLRDTLTGWTPPRGISYLRLSLSLRNGGQEAHLLRIQYYPEGITVRQVTPALGWREGVAGRVASWQLSTAAPACIATPSSTYCADKIDSIGSVWLPPFLSASAELRAYTYADTIKVPLSLPPISPTALPYAPWASLGYTVPVGFYLPTEGEDWNGDGERDLLLSGIDPNTGRIGRLYFLHREGNRYLPYDSASTEGSFLPRDLADWDQDSQAELLCVWIDSFYVFGGSPPKNLLWKGRGRAARLGPGRCVWVREESGAYTCLSDGGNRLLSLPDTTSQQGNTTIPRLLRVARPGDTIWVFGNYAGWLFFYDATGNLLQAQPTGLIDVGTHLHATDVEGDGSEEILYAGQTPDQEAWEMGLLGGPMWQPQWKYRFWGGKSGGIRLFCWKNLSALWLPPHLYVGYAEASQWRGQAFDAGIWGAFGVFALGGDTVLFLGRDSVAQSYRLIPPAWPGPVWAYPGGLSPTQVLLRWHPLQPGLTYELYRFQVGGPAVRCFIGTDTLYIDTGLSAGEEYFYAVRAVGGAFSPPFLVQPGERPCLETASAEEGLVRVRGRGQWESTEGEAFTLLPSREKPLLALGTGPEWLLHFASLPDSALLLIDTLLTDARGRFLSPTCTSLAVSRTSPPPCIQPRSWSIIGEESLQLSFTEPLPARAYFPEAYRLYPAGSVERVDSIPGGLILQVSLPPSITPLTVEWDWAPGGCPHRVAFSPTEVQHTTWGLYPNPVKPPHKQVHIWGLAAGTIVQVLAADGSLCTRFRITEWESPTLWDLRKVDGSRLSSGIYLVIAEKGLWRGIEKLVIE